MKLQIDSLSLIYIYIYTRLSNDSKKPISPTSLNKLIKTDIKYYLNNSYTKRNNQFDISKVNHKNIPKNIDIFTYSFPCQDLSIQGKQQGMNKEYKNRSSLLWEIERIIYELKNNFKISEMPKYLLMENVPSIINKNHINEFEKWKNSLNDLNYESQLYLLNSKDFGSAQNRNRAFLLSVNKYWKQKVNFNFQNIEPTNKNVFLKDILESNPDEKYFLDDLLNKYKLSEFKTTKSNIKRAHLISYTKFNSESYVYNINGYGPTLTATGANSRIKIFTHDKRIRTLTDLEVFLYMGFTKDDYEKIKKSNLINLNKMIFLCGNSINVNVLEAIFKTLEF